MSKKRTTPSAKEVGALRKDLKSLEVKRDRWKARAKELEATNADLRERLKRAEKQLRKASERSMQASPSGGEPATDDTARDTGPDASWTVVQLRDEARRRGLTGLWNMPKAELVAALR